MELKIVTIQNSLKRNDKSNDYALEVKQVYRSYKGEDYAVKGVSFGVSSGECFGLLGKNGAGKSTIFKMLSGELLPTFGSINYYNREVSYCPQTSAVDPLLTVEEVIKFYGKLRRVKNTYQLTETTLKSFNLESYRKVLVKNLSGGNRRKLNVAVACIGYSSVVLMDEPTSDMDPITRSLVYSAIRRLLAEQRSVVLTSHTISEIESICHNIVVLKDGQIIKEGSPQSLKSQFGEFYTVSFYLNNQKDDKFMSVKKAISETLKVKRSDIQIHSHSIKFLVQVNQKTIVTNGIMSDHQVQLKSLKLSELIEKLNKFSETHSIPFTINRCRLDTIFEKILDSSDVEGGFIHNGFVDTET